MESGSTRADAGSALLIVILAMTLLMGLGAGLTLLATTEARLAAHFAAGLETLYAAEAAIARVMPDLASTSDWTSIASGAARSTFVDGGAAGVRAVADGRRLDLAALTNVERCGRPAPCDDDQAETPWQLYAHSPLQALAGAERSPSRAYVVVWVAPGDRRGGADALLVRARAYGLYGTRRGVDVTIRRDEAMPRVIAWREL